MQCTLFNDQLAPIHRRRKKTRNELGVHASLDRIAVNVERVLEDANVPASSLTGIGIGCPGPVEWEKGVVRVAVNLGWENVHVGEFLEKRFGCPVSVLNDVDAGVYGEYIAGAAKGSRTCVGIFPGTGIGGGCVYDGQILRGKVLSCMEIGHIKLVSSPRQGATGMTGTLETEASRLSIAGELVKLAFRGEAPNLLKAAGTDLSEVRSKVIAEAIRSGDKQVQRVVEEACEVIGFAVANIVLLICPDTVILGGGLVEAMPELFLKEVSKTAKRHVFDCYRREFEIKCAQLGDDAAALGAAAWIAKQVANTPLRK
ncbi:MAG: ROK family protein [Planctomycetales bacterium]|nr:ROK family protein [Planctomycetales bacterium]